MTTGYVHGYAERENIRLNDQASTLVELLHSDTAYPAGSKVLEAGCGVGAQTITLAANSPDADILSIDISARSLAEAERRITEAGLKNVRFQQADIFDLPFEADSFDHIFVCFVLEHLPRPVEALVILKRLLKVGGTITVIEGDHGSTYFHPESAAAHQAIQCQVQLQAQAGGNSNGAGGRQFQHRSRTVPAADGSRFPGDAGFTPDGLCGWQQTAHDRGVHPQHLHSHDRRRTGSSPGRRTD